MKTSTHYEIEEGNGRIGNKKGIYRFDTEKEAIDEAIQFKNNPRSHNTKMSDENVQYWQSKMYIVVKKTIITEIIKTI